MSERLTDPRYRSWEALRLMPRATPSPLEDTNVPGWWLPQTPRQFDAEVTGPNRDVQSGDDRQVAEMQRLWGMMGLDSGGVMASFANPRQLGRLMGSGFRPEAEEGFIRLADADRMVSRSGVQGRPLREPDNYNPADYNTAWNEIAPQVYSETGWMPWLDGARWPGVQREWLYGLEPPANRDIVSQSIMESPSAFYRDGRLIPGYDRPLRDTTLPQLLDSPRHFTAEPRTRQLRVRDTIGGDDGVYGGFDPQGWQVERNFQLPSRQDNYVPMLGHEGWRSLAHEVQHAFQNSRGPQATQGSSVAIAGNNTPTSIWFEYLNNALANPNPNATAPRQAAFDVYNRTPGEWEARAAENIWGTGSRYSAFDSNDTQFIRPDWRLIPP